MARRSRSNDGHRSSLTGTLPISTALLAAFTAQFAEHHERRAPRIFHGPKPANAHHASPVTDEQVIAIRRMREWHGMTGGKIARLTGINRWTVEGLLDYRNRGHLDPGPRPAPAEAETQQAA